MKVIAFLFCLFCFSAGYAQRIQGLNDVRRMMKDARDTGVSPCLVITFNKDTTWGKDLDWKWNKKLKVAEWDLDGKTFTYDSVRFHQDKDGFHAILVFTNATTRVNQDIVRIMRGKVDLYISNWDVRGTQTKFKPGTGYVPGTGSYTPSQYYLLRNGKWWLVTYGNLKECISDNAAAIDRYHANFSDSEPDKKAITDWGKLKEVMEIYLKE